MAIILISGLLLALSSAQESCEIDDLEEVASFDGHTSFVQLSIAAASNESIAIPADTTQWDMRSRYLPKYLFNSPEYSGSSKSINPPALLAAAFVIAAFLWIFFIGFGGSTQAAPEGTGNVVEAVVPTTWRTVTGVMLFTMMMILHSTRAESLLVLKGMAASHGYSASLTESSFFGGFFMASPLMGILCGPESLGAKRCLTVAMSLSSAVSMLMPWFAEQSVGMLFLARLVLGMCAAAAFPSGMALLAAWTPMNQRSVLSSAMGAGECLGAAFALTAPTGTIVFGAFGLIWVAALQLLVTDSPATHPKISQAEALHIRTCLEAEFRGQTSKRYSYWQLLQFSEIWVLAFATFCWCCSWGICQSRLADFLESVDGVYSASKTGMRPQSLGQNYLGALANIGAIMIWGGCMDRCLRQKMFSLLDIRRIAFNIAMLGSAACFTWTLSFMYILPAACRSISLSIASILMAANRSGSWANILDIGGTKDTPQISALMDTVSCACMFFASCMPTSWIETVPMSLWPLVLLLLTMCNSTAACVYTSTATSRHIELADNEKLAYKMEW
mmetsp:Transcript_80910/g.142732  ORF Transcript_80910/g.142732 Transcript_80910/m.142732 type:complete len:560 (+) Transcript_80910:69-1748(+)|eukprot:CAMPEP_0197658598 /NCGR_PEP_ID=MMETSP1338-20131121/45327_1 /TAXON_ID=43686 ORGANISM="Pelagodinium beii, Strain RCC1491" /NCGR_SAMPLE_ID=MMETSP1338 /ASSEMBLY_ACC=CAM_ASM_000754 /LENGTH=559 /DNA_ID=CAMNT_0043235211 /DNA_START=70 /DNA_END=1746 /DNA_ORIENTATION=-